MKSSLIAGMFALALSCGLILAADEKKEAPKDNAKKVEQKDAKKPTTRPTTQVAKKPVNKMCAVEQEHEADLKVTYLYKEKMYAFCCESCIDEFKKNPEKYKNAK